MWTGSWWRSANASALADGFDGIVAVIVFIDDTVATAHRMHAACPVVVTLGNLPARFRQQDQARELVSYLPTRAAGEAKEQFHSRRMKALKVLVERSFAPAVGRVIVCGGKRLVVRIALVAADIKELWWQCGLQLSASAAFPCVWCECPKEQLYTTEEGRQPTAATLRTAARSAQLQGTLGYTSAPPLLALPDFDVFEQTAPDPLHAASMGVFNLALRDVHNALSRRERKMVYAALAAAGSFPSMRLPRDVEKHINKSSKPAYRTMSLAVTLPYILLHLQVNLTAAILLCRMLEHYALTQKHELHEDDLERMQEAGHAALRTYVCRLACLSPMCFCGNVCAAVCYDQFGIAECSHWQGR